MPESFMMNVKHLIYIYSFLFSVLACDPSTSPQKSNRRVITSSIPSRIESNHKQTLIAQTLRNCESETLWNCQSWYWLYKQLASDLRYVKSNAPSTITETKRWINSALKLIQSTSPLDQTVGSEVISIIVERLKFRSLPNHALITEQLISFSKKSDNPIHIAKLITILNHLIPLGSGQLFYEYTALTLPTEAQVAAWTVIADRHSKREPVSLSKIKKAIRKTSSLSVKASLIKAATPLKSAKVIRWCGKNWWQDELFVPCRDALASLGNERSAYELWKWVKNIFEEVDQAINSDQMIAESLTYLSTCTRSPRSQRRYRKILDQFFSRRRSENAAILVSQSWLKLPSARFALEISLRYFRPKTAKIVTQSHFFEQNLKHIIYQLSNPSNTNK
jgi:hypothetical protein